MIRKSVSHNGGHGGEVEVLLLSPEGETQWSFTPKPRYKACDVLNKLLFSNNWWYQNLLPGTLMTKIKFSAPMEWLKPFYLKHLGHKRPCMNKDFTGWICCEWF